LGSNAVIGAAGGEATHTLSAGELPAHTHNTTGGQNTGSFGDSGRFAYGDGTAVSIVTTDGGNGLSGTAHNNVQPTISVNYVIKT
jgi:microcystin-dependent protein